MRLAKFVKFREEKFGGVLFETKSEKVFTLSTSAAAIVREINVGGGDEAAITARLKDQFDRPRRRGDRARGQGFSSPICGSADSSRIERGRCHGRNRERAVTA
jgi:hypothetical protein